MKMPSPDLNKDQFRYMIAILIQAAYSSLDKGDYKTNHDPRVDQTITQLGMGLSILSLNPDAYSVSVVEAMDVGKFNLKQLLIQFADQKAKGENPKIPDVDQLAQLWVDALVR